MNRRSFLRGALISATAGTALVKLATVAETQFLSTAAPVALGNLEPEILPYWHGSSPEVYMRHQGVFLCVGLLREIRVSQDVTDMMTWDGQVVIVPGLKREEFSFQGQY
jgi:drug/metabolite transporter superfamily protein YnfA